MLITFCAQQKPRGYGGRPNTGLPWRLSHSLRVFVMSHGQTLHSSTNFGDSREFPSYSPVSFRSSTWSFRSVFHVNPVAPWNEIFRVPRVGSAKRKNLLAILARLLALRRCNCVRTARAAPAWSLFILGGGGRSPASMKARSAPKRRILRIITIDDVESAEHERSRLATRGNCAPNP